MLVNFSQAYRLILQIICVIVPIGQKVHQVLGLNNAITTKPSSIEDWLLLCKNF